MNNVLFSSLTLNLAPLHLDADYSKDTVYGQRLVNSLFILAPRFSRTPARSPAAPETGPVDARLAPRVLVRRGDNRSGGSPWLRST